jgi:hypothetical protein
MFRSGQKPVTLPSFGVVRNDILKPTSLGFMKNELSEDQVAKETDISTIIDDNLKILGTLTMPKQLDFKDVGDFLRKTIKEEVEKDPLHEVCTRLVKYARDFFMKMEKYFAEIYNFEGSTRENLLARVFANTKEFVISDIPSSYVRELALSFFTEKKYSELFIYRIQREQAKLLAVRHDMQKFKKICDEHNKWVDLLHSKLIPMIEARSRLVWYVDLQNSQKVEDLFKIKKLRRSNLDEANYLSILMNLSNATEQFRSELMRIDRERYATLTSREDPTVDLLCSAVEYIGSRVQP